MERSAIEAAVRAAVAADLSDIGISSHAPLPFATDWNMPLSLLPDYVRQVCDLKEVYKNQIAIWLGAEIDYIPGGTSPAASTGPDIRGEFRLFRRLRTFSRIRLPSSIVRWYS